MPGEPSSSGYPQSHRKQKSLPQSHSKQRSLILYQANPVPVVTHKATGSRRVSFCARRTQFQWLPTKSQEAEESHAVPDEPSSSGYPQSHRKQKSLPQSHSKQRSLILYQANPVPVVTHKATGSRRVSFCARRTQFTSGSFSPAAEEGGDHQ